MNLNQSKMSVIGNLGNRRKSFQCSIFYSRKGEKAKGTKYSCLLSVEN